jgi:hypothetical protein
VEGSERTKLGRRALLAAAAAGVAAAAVRAVAAPAGVAAADHDPLKIGETNTSSAETILQAFSSHGLSASSGAGDGFRGSSSVGDKSGVYGYSTNADGFGVYGRNTALRTIGYLGGKGSGVYGFSPVANVAVKGESSSPGGAAVLGINTATGAQGGLGLRSSGVWGGAPTDLNHWGLEIAEGRVSFSRSGLLTIAAGSSSVSTTRPALSPTTMVLATLQTNRAGVYIQAAVASPAAGKITIYLNKKVTAATKVAYFILG